MQSLEQLENRKQLLTGIKGELTQLDTKVKTLKEAEKATEALKNLWCVFRQVIDMEATS